jgi:hypothetical protein
MANPDPSPSTRFAPGVSGNPAGRPKTKPLTDRLREILADPAEVDRVVRSWIDGAAEGDVGALRTLLDWPAGR